MNVKNIIFGTTIYGLFSLSSVFMKFASMAENIIGKLVLFCISIIMLGVFSILWQKMLNKMNLNRAYYFKATTIIWGLLMGVIFFQEKISFNMIIGSIICLIGVIIILGDKKYE